MTTQISHCPMPLFVDGKQIRQRLRITGRTLQRWVAAGEFPPPIKLSSRCLRWRWIDVQHHLASLEVKS